MPVPILKQGTILIATMQAALTDSDLSHAPRRPDGAGSASSAPSGVIVDVTALDVMDSFACAVAARPSRT